MMLRRQVSLIAAVAAGVLVTASCMEVDIPSGEGLFPDESFITGGTMEVDPRGPECSLFHADNGLDYHLFQGPRLTNDEYDQLFENGARARLEIQVRGDLELRCGFGRNAEVVEVLEFIPASQAG
jgi:hypothetical protein